MNPKLPKFAGELSKEDIGSRELCDELAGWGDWLSAYVDSFPDCPDFSRPSCTGDRMPVPRSRSVGLDYSAVHQPLIIRGIAGD